MPGDWYYLRKDLSLEVQPRHASEPIDELDVERVIQPEPIAQIVDLLLVTS
ncbi:MAG: hypothetical protein R2849_18815 [Thermomicrobiales bacterium]